MALFGGQRDIRLFNTINRELLKDIIDTTVDIFKPAILHIKENLYGEAINKQYFPGVRVAALISHDDQMTDSDEFGTDINQTATFSFLKDIMEHDLNLVLEGGDIIYWDNAYWEIDQIVENQYIRGENEKTTRAAKSTDAGKASINELFRADHRRLYGRRKDKDVYANRKRNEGDGLCSRAVV